MQDSYVAICIISVSHNYHLLSTWNKYAPVTLILELKSMSTVSGVKASETEMDLTLSPALKPI